MITAKELRELVKKFNKETPDEQFLRRELLDFQTNAITEADKGNFKLYYYLPERFIDYTITKPRGLSDLGEEFVMVIKNAGFSVSRATHQGAWLRDLMISWEEK